MVSLPGVPQLTSEQQDILNTCPAVGVKPQAGKGQLTRITAAAGAGKTTTLLALAVKASELGHKHITYVTFTNAAANDGRKRLRLVIKDPHVTIDARTLHSCAHRLLQTHSEQQQSGEGRRPRLWSDKSIKRWISDQCSSEIDSFLSRCRQNLSRRNERHKWESLAREQVEFFIFKSLTHFCQSKWTLDTYASGSPFSRDYYPAKLFHSGEKGEQYGFEPSHYKQRVGFYAEQTCKLWEIVLRDDIRSFNFEMKRAQLLGLRVPGSLLLVDESQDMDACQVDWISGQQVGLGTHVYVVGDPAQAIYGFRGAKPQFLMELKSDHDRMLTESWRFGPAISRIANLVLYAKEKSEQTALTFDGRFKNWRPYRTKPGILDKAAVVTTKPLVEDWQSIKVTLIARTNAALLVAALGVLGFVFSSDDGREGEEEEEGDDSNNDAAEEEEDAKRINIVSPDSDDDFVPFPDEGEAYDSNVDSSLPRGLPKIHINGRGEGSGLSLWMKTLRLVRSVYELYLKFTQDPSVTMSLDGQLFPDFAGKQVTWMTFCDVCIQKELSQYANVIMVVQDCKMRTLEAMDTFQRHVMEHRFSADEADIILSTCHSAKGMEWDNVQLCNDFKPLSIFKKKDPVSSPGSRRFLSLPGSPKKPRLADSWQFGFASWGDDVNLAYVACTRAKHTLSIPHCISGALDSLDVVHAWVDNLDSGVNKLGLQIEGCKQPLSKEDADCFDRSLVLPFRLECDVAETQSLTQALVRCNSVDDNDDKTNDTAVN